MVFRGMDNVAFRLALSSAIGVGALAGLMWPSAGPRVQALALTNSKAQIASRRFAICHTGGGVNCVVDGDTAWIDSVKIRVADIDAPETHPPRCSREAELGSRATQRLASLLSAGPFQLEPIDRDEDRFGRKLRIIRRDGQS